MSSLSIPKNSNVYQTLLELAETCRVVVFSGLPGVGKSLYVQTFRQICNEGNKELDIIQWDIARKAFETDFILAKYPMGDGTVHNGLKVIAGTWLMNYLSHWWENNIDSNKVLLIEAPLVGHRFVELVKPTDDKKLEKLLSSEQCRFVVPIPSKKVRKAIEASRASQVSDDAENWIGAKPSVMLMLWKMTCEIANEFGMDIDTTGQPPYSDSVYEYVFGEILSHRHFEPLIVDELFDVSVAAEEDLHDVDSIQPNEEQANAFAKAVIEKYSDEELDLLTSAWYLT